MATWILWQDGQKRPKPGDIGSSVYGAWKLECFLQQTSGLEWIDFSVAPGAGWRQQMPRPEPASNAALKAYVA